MKETLFDKEIYNYFLEVVNHAKKSSKAGSNTGTAIGGADVTVGENSAGNGNHSASASDMKGAALEYEQYVASVLNGDSSEHTLAVNSTTTDANGNIVEENDDAPSHSVGGSCAGGKKGTSKKATNTKSKASKENVVNKAKDGNKRATSGNKKVVKGKKKVKSYSDDEEDEDDVDDAYDEKFNMT
jgi:hypothetical protein